MIKLTPKYQAYLALSLSLSVSLVAVLASVVQAQSSQQNDFFGAGLPNTQQVQPSSASSSAAPSAGAASGLVPAPTGNGASPTDFTQDEKRMQKKNKAMAEHIKGLIEKGDRMMKDGIAHHNTKLEKKVKILKEIGERRQAELRANAQAALDAKKEKDKADGT